MINRDVVFMVPAKGYSERISNKNMRLLGGKPLVKHVLDTLGDLRIPTYLNSDSDAILDLCKGSDCIAYKRDPSLCTDEATNDDFMFDFMNNVKSDFVVQVLPTSPFITASEIKNFVDESLTCDTLISVKEERIACVYGNLPVNFSKTEKNPRSQDMNPLLVYATSLMGWRSVKFIENMINFGCAYHGGDGNTRYHTLRGLSTIDIDTEDDFQVAQRVLSKIDI
jgi:CMP-N-acetylneuraminic acid synthetase